MFLPDSKLQQIAVTLEALPLWDNGFHHEFMIDGKRCRLTIRWIGSRPEYDLQVGFWPYIGT
jgi:hypothetical protein